jgi:acetolactate synthase I/III small subunit
MKENYTITVFTENHIGLLNRITIIFTRRQVNIESLNVSQSSIKGIHKFTIVVNETKEKVEKVVKQIDKIVEVMKAFYHTDNDIVHQEIALYKVPTEELLKSVTLEQTIRKYNARILEITSDYTVIEKTGYKEETQELFDQLSKYGIMQFTRSGRVAVTKLKEELFSNYLRELDSQKLF